MINGKKINLQKDSEVAGFNISPNTYLYTDGKSIYTISPVSFDPKKISGEIAGERIESSTLDKGLGISVSVTPAANTK